MMRKKILVTTGPVYGKIDDNKIISNRTRGIWAIKLAEWLAKEHRCEVRLLVADTLRPKEIPSWTSTDGKGGHLVVTRHSGYHDYAEKCRKYAPDLDAAVMAAAVLNYIPETTYDGKLPAKADRIALHFILAPKVINDMKKTNPKMTLIGCKLLFSDDEETLVDAAYKVVLDARCNMVIANDGKLGLKKKFLVHQDRTVVKLDNDFDALYEHIRDHIEDKHWSTDLQREDRGRILHYSYLFNDVVEKYRDKFIKRQDDKDFVFGSVATRHVDPGYDHGPPEFLISPREKGQDFDNWDAGVCSFSFQAHRIKAWAKKVTLNAPLLARHLNQYEDAVAVVHYHAPQKDDPGIEGLLPVAPYAPPGTLRDNNRLIPGPCYYIEGHGWIIALDKNLEPLRP